MSAVGRSAGSVREFLAASRGAHIALESLCYFHATTGLTGYFLWSDPSAEDLAALSSIIGGSLDLDPHPSLIDGREVQTPPIRFFEHMASFVADRGPRLTQSVERLALIRSSGIVGAAALGFFDLVQSPYPVSSFQSLEPALAWLRQPDPAELAKDLEELAGRARGIPALVQRLRALVRARLAAPDDEEVAAGLGLSTRTLHRRLSELGTTFGDEVGQMRVEAAKALLADTDTPITRIALDLGCSSLSTFSTLFRKWAGTTPTEYRKGRRDVTPT